MTTYFLQKQCTNIECTIDRQGALEEADELASQGTWVTVEERSDFAPFAFIRQVQPEFWIVNGRTGSTKLRYTLEGATRLADELQAISDTMGIEQSYIVRQIEVGAVYFTQWAKVEEVY